jgi:hypothetical protein
MARTLDKIKPGKSDEHPQRSRRQQLNPISVCVTALLRYNSVLAIATKRALKEGMNNRSIQRIPTTLQSLKHEEGGGGRVPTTKPTMEPFKRHPTTPIANPPNPLLTPLPLGINIPFSYHKPSSLLILIHHVLQHQNIWPLRPPAFRSLELLQHPPLYHRVQNTPFAKPLREVSSTTE